MTPFGKRVREMRAERKIPLKTMAHALDISPAYLSALEHGHRGQPSHHFVQRIITYFNVIWDEAEELERLAALSHPRVVIDTSGLDPMATELANRLAETIELLNAKDLELIRSELEERLKARPTALDRG
ncbi:MAG: helix-turn-helix transcriptional regulator [Hyphomicrobiales bacterium]|nr:helix-turn-helix transcriptional regulator [Hyphomicrobiales bacterium]